MSLLTDSLLEPCSNVGVLHMPHVQMLSAVDIARTMLCTCRAMRSELSGRDATRALMEMMRIGSLSAFEVSQLFAPEWMRTSEQFLASRVLRWIDGFQRSLFYEDFMDQQLFGLRQRLPVTSSKLQWRRYGNMSDPDLRCIEHANFDTPAKCLSLSLGKSFSDARRGVTAFFAQPLRPGSFDTLLRVSLDRDRPAQQSTIGYMILSDGAPWSPTAQGQFGSEAVCIFCRVEQSHEITLYAVGSGQNHVLSKLPVNDWVHLSLYFDWAKQRLQVLVSQPDGENHGHVTSVAELPFAGKCQFLRQTSLLSLEDSGHATVSWTSMCFHETGGKVLNEMAATA
eukprot:TRINITY_DN55743_c0_g1_i1.p1 TRINITY_DN55743_c0_g1~~TRINITY_DN55743_c0_g1_i1.p1  ORF type:complete len:339 (-),score=52.37 TRINITY_DN55743_c0_g1_i1:60-1076(-)